VLNDVDVRLSDGRLFHARGPATANARSPMVERRVEGTTRSADDTERRRRRAVLATGTSQIAISLANELYGLKVLPINLLMCMIMCSGRYSYFVLVCLVYFILNFRSIAFSLTRSDTSAGNSLSVPQYSYTIVLY